MIRAYSSQDKEELMALLRLNIPQFFAESEENDFEIYLDKEVEDYFIVENMGKIIGSGGINYFNESNRACISWDIIHPNFHGKGIGRRLMLYRIDHIRHKSAIQWITVRTTQLVYKFYQKMGFELEKTEKDYWAKGFDLYQMRLELKNESEHE